jgi:HAD superfamily hydrolase (TIGR01509 family)
LLILDCDGVLVDSESIALRVEARLLASLGKPLADSEIQERFLGQPSETILEDIERHTGVARAVWLEERDRLQQRAFERELRPVDGVIEALAEVRMLQCVASNGSRERVAYSLRVCGLYERFAGRIFTAAEVPRGKPAPDLFLHAAARMAVEPADAVVVEDSPLGVEGALAAGMRVCAFSGGLVSPERLAQATVVFSRMKELPGLLRTI